MPIIDVMSLLKCTVRQYELARNNSALVPLNNSSISVGKYVATRLKDDIISM
jgi:hypothetical protein